MPKSVEKSLIFRLNDNGQGPEIIQQVFLENGWQEFDEDIHHEQEWNLWWRTSRFRNSDYDQLRPWQWLNHYPRSTAITKKDCLARNMKRMKGVYGPLAYNFSPTAFNLPNDYTRFVAEYTKHHEKKSNVCWICKPADLSRGRGIFIFRELSELQYDCNAVVQQYISNPLLISGYKFDLRLYVLVPSFHPLQIFVYEEGLVRFSTEKFDLNALGNHYAHLTNTSINKHSPNYMLDKERVGAGCKWTLRQLRHYFHQVNIDDNVLWGKIVNIIVLTLVIQGTQVPKVERCFELYGFDVMIDEDLKAWLLEVNFSPALSSDCQADIIVKKSMLNDLLEMIGFSEEDKLHGGEAVQPAHPHKAYSSSSSRSSEHRRSLGYGQRKDLSGHLPKIASNHNMIPADGSGRETDDGYNDGEPQVIPIIPGCGLPSVQQTVLQQSSVPACASPVSDIESRGLSKTTNGNTKKTTRVGHRHTPEEYPKLSHHLGAPNNMKHSLSSQAMKKSHGNTKQAFPKRDSKLSTQSDSGFSSFSGSSENSDVTSQYEEGSKSSAKGLMKDKTSTVSIPSQIKNRANIIHRNSEAESEGSVSSVTQQSSHTSSRLSTGQRSIARCPPVSSHSVSRVLKGPGGIPGSQPSKHRSHFVPVISNSVAHRPSSLYPISKLGSGTIKGQAVVRSQWRDRSDRMSSPSEVGVIPRVGSRTPPDRVGDFVRVFPFNDATKKCSLGNMDIKIIVRECHKLLRERTRGVKGQGEQTTPIKLFDVPFLWKPLSGEGIPH